MTIDILMAINTDMIIITMTTIDMDTIIMIQRKVLM